VYRHDVHKLRGRAREHAVDELHGIAVNGPVPFGADRDAALLSRPDGLSERTLENHETRYRRSLRTGEPARAERRREPLETIVDLTDATDPEVLHARWLTSTLPALYHESLYLPYTSLKYHTLLAGALLDNYCTGHAFDELWLVATRSTDDASDNVGSCDYQTEAGQWSARVDRALRSDVVEPHRTVLWQPEVTLTITGTPDGRPAASLGPHPARSFADTWTRLPTHPLDTDVSRVARLLDAQCRRCGRGRRRCSTSRSSCKPGRRCPDDHPNRRADRRR